MATIEGRRDTRRALADGVVRRTPLRARLELFLVAVALVLLALANGELAAARAQAAEERARTAETRARIDRISDEIQGVILELITAGPEAP